MPRVQSIYANVAYWRSLAHTAYTLFSAIDYLKSVIGLCRTNVAFIQHIKAAMLIGGAALYTALFAAAEQVASNPNDGHEGV